MPGSPRVSVIIPHYNMHTSLVDAVASVARQNYPNTELIVVDDGSDQNLDEDLLPKDDLKLVEIAHAGKPRAVNKGFKVATGSYFTILDADDQLPSNSIFDRINIVREHNSDLCIGSFEIRYRGERQSVRSIESYIDSENSQLARELLMNIISPFHQNAMLFSKELLKRTGGMDERMIRAQDKDFAISLLQNSQATSYVNRPVYIYNRYDRPFSKRVINRITGARYKIHIIKSYSSGWRKLGNTCWGIMVEAAKLLHDLFGVYKK